MAETTDNDDDEFSSVVWDAAKDGKVDEVVAAVASHPHLIDTPNPHDWSRTTPLHVAAAYGHVGVVEKLIELGSKAIDTPDTYFGRTPLNGAAFNGQASTIEALVRLGSKAIDTPTNDSWTPLHTAATRGHASAIEALVGLGSKAIDTPDNNGCTPLYAAASNGHVSVIEALVGLGSKAIDTPNRFGYTPLKEAALNSHEKCLNALRWLGADCSNVSTKWLPEDMIELLQAPVDEDQAAEIRYRVFFSQSLVGRLLCLPFATDADAGFADDDEE